MPVKMKKGLPKRASNAHRKAKRAESWARGQERKKKRREEQEKRHQENLRRKVASALAA